MEYERFAAVKIKDREPDILLVLLAEPRSPFGWTNSQQITECELRAHLGRARYTETEINTLIEEGSLQSSLI